MSDSTNNINHVYVYTSDSFRKCILNDDVEGAKQSIEKGGQYPVTASEVKNASYRGCMKCLRWLVEDLKVQPCWIAVPYSVKTGKHNAVLYLLQHKAPVSKASIELLFERYRCDVNISQPNNKSLRQYKKLGIDIDQNNEVSLYMRMILSLCKAYKIGVDESCLRYCFIRLWFQWREEKDIDQIISDIKYLLAQENVTVIKKKYIISRMILIGIDNDHIRELIGLMKMDNMKLSMNIIQECLFECDYPKSYCGPATSSNRLKQIWENLRLAVKQHQIIVNDNKFVEIKNSELFRCILDNQTFSIEYLGKWLYYHLKHNHECEPLIELFNKKHYWDHIDVKLKEKLILEALVCQPALFDLLVEAMNWTICIRWINVVKKYGSYQCNRAQIELQKTPLRNLNLIDFSEPQELDFKEKWMWVGINPKIFETYGTFEYEDHPIDHIFSHIKTIDDLKDHVKKLPRDLKSPTACYFDFTDDVFYRDQQDCVIWALDNKGRVYIKDYDQPYVKYYVAKSLPEFLSHVKADNICWYNNHLNS